MAVSITTAISMSSQGERPGWICRRAGWFASIASHVLHVSYQGRRRASGTGSAARSAVTRRIIIDDRLVLSVADEAKLDYAFVVFMAISGLLASVAFLTDSVPILMGAMIVAPVYPPLALVALGIAAGMGRLAGRGLLVALLGLAIAVIFAVLSTWLLNVFRIIPPEMNLVNQPLLEERVRTGWYSTIAGAGAGVAGMIATIRRKQNTLIGIVAAIALVPAGAAGGMALFSGDSIRALGGFVLLVTNVGLIIAMGILVIALVRPGPEEVRERQKEEGQAKESA